MAQEIRRGVWLADTETGLPPGSIGDLCLRVGTDVRDLFIMGYELEEVYAVARGECTLEELLQRGPRRKRRKRKQ